MPWNWPTAAAVMVSLMGLLAAFRPPTYHLWKLSVPVREAGHWMVVPCLLFAWAAFRSGASGRIAGALFLIAAGLFGMTLVRAGLAARRVSREFAAAWGPVSPPPGGFLRPTPLDLADLFRGIALPPSRPETFAYSGDGGEALKLDFLRARPGSEPAPCILVLHGGGWDGGSRDQMPSLNAFLSGAGYAVATLDYRLAPRFTYPAPVEDVGSALRWLKANADRLGLDPGRFVLAGRSAGGQIALQAAYRDPDPAIKAVIAFYAPADMVLGYRHPCSPWVLDSPRLMAAYLGGSGDLTPLARNASPLEHVKPGVLPTLLLHGRPDVICTWEHTARMRESLERAGARHFEVDLPWAPHGYDFVFNGPGSQISVYILERFLAAVLRGAGGPSARHP